MKWIWFNAAALIVFFALVLRGVPVFPVLLGIGLSAATNYYRLRSRAA
ncbi:MAG: hypothetical protein HY821_11485 [Acidobacteria bacterium]|nr:hypothetical protein [Acidobacteriota bacterium]